MNKTTWVALAIVGLIIAIVVILAGGGSPTTGESDGSDDVTITDGTGEPGEAVLADITAASVKKSGGDIVFEVRVADVLPQRLRGATLNFRWDVSENGAETWIVSADLDAGPTASVSSLGSSYGASTVDGTLPGSIELSEDSLVVTLTASEIEGFPTTFDWKLTSTLDGDPADPSSATAKDTAPDSGAGRLE